MSLSLLNAMSNDLAVRARIKPTLVRLALDAKSAAPLAEDAPINERTLQAKRKAYANLVLIEPNEEAERAHWAAVCWRGASGITTAYQNDGAAGVSDSDIEWVLTNIWDALADA